MSRSNISVAAVRVLAALACLSSVPLSAAEIALTSEQAKALGVGTAKITAAARGELPGLAAQVVVPNRQMHVVSAPLGGLIELLGAAANQAVKSGDTLARIQSPALAEAQRDFLQAHSQAELARINLARDQALLSEGIIAESRFQTTRSMQAEAAAAAGQRRRALQLAGMSENAIRRLEQSREISATLTVVAPIDGVVLQQLASVGQRIDAYTALYTIARLDPLWLEIQVPLARAAGVREGALVSVPAYQAKGRIISVGRSVNPDSQTLMLRALVGENARRLRPGQYVEVTVATAAGDGKQWIVPNGALARQDGRILVFVRSAKGFNAVPVEIASEGPQSSVVAGTLSEGDEIAVTGVSALKAILTGTGGN